MSGQYKEKRLYGLGLLANVIRWFEELLNTLSGVALMAGAGIAVVDLLTNGALSAISPAFIFFWAISQAVGIETQLLGSFARAREAARRRDAGAVFGWLVLGVLLLAITVMAGYTYSVVREQGISTVAALAQIGVSNFMFLGMRAIFAGALVALSGWTRYIGEPPKRLSAAEQIRDMEERAQLSQASARLNAARASAWVKAAKSTAKAALNRDEEVEEEAGDPEAATADDNVVNFARKGGKKRKKVVSESVVEGRIRKLLEGHPNMALNELMKRAHVSLSTASKWKKIIQAERASA